MTITPSSTRTYPDLAATSGTSTTAPFEFVLQESAAYATTINFVMTTSYNGVTRTFPFSVPTGQLAHISIRARRHRAGRAQARTTPPPPDCRPAA